jgi:two-component system chemotaxis sensor kinase CheA
MANPMDQFKNTYITECLELLGQMETELMDLDASANKEKLNAIFRCAHSIKGGAGAFGFTAIAQFTHTLEALLDKLREGELAVTRELTDILLRARDIVLAMVIAARDNQTLDSHYGKDVETELKSVIGGGSLQPLPHRPWPQPRQQVAAHSLFALYRCQRCFPPAMSLCCSCVNWQNSAKPRSSAI